MRAIHRTVPGLIGVLTLGWTIATPHAHAAPQSTNRFYPAHTLVTKLPQVSNQQMDCAWGFACQDGRPVTSAPLFHFLSQSDLHRLDGWARFGDAPGPDGRMLFTVFASRYSRDSHDGMPWNVRAFADFRGTLMSERYEDLPLNRVPRMVPHGAIGNISLQMARSLDGDLVAMACWTGSIEIEGTVVYVHGSKAAQRIAVRDLARQIRAAAHGW